MVTGYFSNIYSGRAGKRNPGCHRKCSRTVRPLWMTQKTTGRSVQEICDNNEYE